MPNEIPVVFYKDSNYDYHFTIKELASKFEEQFEFFLGKHRKVQKYFRSDRKRSYKGW